MMIKFNGVKRVGCGKCDECRQKAKRKTNVYVAVSVDELSALDNEIVGSAGDNLLMALAERVRRASRKCVKAEMREIDTLVNAALDKKGL